MHGVCELIDIRAGDVVLVTGPGAIGLTAAQDLGGRVRELTSGEGVDVVIECSGADRAIRSGMEAVRKQGQFLQLGLRGRDIELRFDALVYKEIRVVGALSSRDVSWRKAIELIRDGRVKPQALVSAPRRLDDWQDAFRAHEEKKEPKILFRPD